ncbi:MAG: chorismate synthase, partial [Clostridia bacterium]|nr:chorismate synthase [Clostridia bacterium]
VKYGDVSSGGGLFSGRSTAALCAAGALLTPYLNGKGVFIGTHIKSIAGAEDRGFSDYKEDIKELYTKKFAVLDEHAGEEMKARILAAKADGDSVGGVLETAVVGLAPGLGEPYFDGLESLLSHILFSVPGVKGMEFGAGFALAEMRGSEANDPFVCENGRVITLTNNSGGINGGIANGMPVVFRCVLRPTPTIRKPQNTVDLNSMTNAVTVASGRHDPCFVHRARAVVDCVTAFVLADLCLGG